MAGRIEWGDADLQWSPSDWSLTVPITLDEREAHLLADRLVERLPAERAALEAVPGEPGYLLIEHSQLPYAIDPDQLRTAIEQALNEVVATAAQDRERDERQRTSFLRRLRRDA